MLPPPGAHPARHRAHDGPLRGEHLPGRADAGAALLPAPGAGLGAVPHAGAQPLHVRLGHPPGRRHHGRARAQRGPCASSRSSASDGHGQRGARRHRHRGGPQRPGHRGLPGAGRAAPAGARGARDRRRARGHRGDPPRLSLPHRDPRGRAAAAAGWRASWRSSGTGCSWLAPRGAGVRPRRSTAPRWPCGTTPPAPPPA